MFTQIILYALNKIFLIIVLIINFFFSFICVFFKVIIKENFLIELDRFLKASNHLKVAVFKSDKFILDIMYLRRFNKNFLYSWLFANINSRKKVVYSMVVEPKKDNRLIESKKG